MVKIYCHSNITLTIATAGWTLKTVSIKPLSITFKPQLSSLTHTCQLVRLDMFSTITRYLVLTGGPYLDPQLGRKHKKVCINIHVQQIIAIFIKGLTNTLLQWFMHAWKPCTLNLKRFLGTAFKIRYPDHSPDNMPLNANQHVLYLVEVAERTFFFLHPNPGPSLH